MPSKPSGGKRGRKARTLSAGEKYLIQEFSDQLKSYVDKIDGDIDKVAGQLNVCRAALYRYLDDSKQVMPVFDTLKRAHDELGFQFRYFNFDVEPTARGKRKRTLDEQGILPFLQALKQENIQVVGKKQVGSQTLELTVQIRFAG
jgi:DNA-binding phage protein